MVRGLGFLGLLLWGLAPGLAPGLASAEDGPLRLAAPAEVVESGLLRHLLPRFSLKHGIRLDVVAADAAADLTLAAGAAGEPAFLNGAGTLYRLSVTGRAEEPAAARFADWLTGEIGQAAVAAFAPDGRAPYAPAAGAARAAPAPRAAGDAAEGERIAYLHCGRCHVVGAKNKFGGIGSTPSFGALRAMPDWEERFSAFWVLNPHPSFTQILDVTEPFDPDRPPHIAPIEIDIDAVEALLDFVAAMAPKNLGGGVVSR